MRILLLNQFFWPDLAATSQLLTDAARELSAQGHEVAVICGSSSYAGHRQSERPTARIEYLPNLRFSKNPLSRLFSYFSFFVMCLWKVAFKPRPDVVVTLTTPPLLSLLGTLMKTTRGCRHVIWEMDVYPELAVQLGLLRESAWLTRMLRSLAGLSRRHADRIIALGDCMRDQLVALGVPACRIVVAENWADGEIFRPVPEKDRSGKFTIVYSGNLGRGHDVETLVAAFDLLRNAHDLRFLFVGGGAGIEALKSASARNDSKLCEFFPYEDPAIMARQHFSIAHVGLVSQKSSCAGLLVPSKVYPLLAAGLPLLFVGPPEATPALIIGRFGCGWQVANGDASGLVKTLRNLARNRDLVTLASERARGAFLERYDLGSGTRRVCLAITEDILSAVARTAASKTETTVPTPSER